LSTKNPLPPPEEINQIQQVLFSDYFKDNPLAFVLWSFPWGKKGSPLERFPNGPRAWQRAELMAMAEHIKENKARVARGEDPRVYKSATASGRGIGKSSLVSWISLWMMSCHIGSTTIISANTDTQLSDKTFGEISVWAAMLVNSFFFEIVDKSVKPAPWYKALVEKELQIGCKYFYANGVLWSDDNPDSFAGAHSQIGMCVIFDESSGIPPVIWPVAQGYFTEKTIYRFWFAFSNPRSGEGYFFDLFNDPENNWSTRQINSLDVEDIDKSELEEIIRKHGSDSDEARVEVFGQFPRQGDRQFINRGIVADAINRELDRYDNHEPLLMGVDPARFGDDSTVIRFRHGRDARTIPPVELKGLDNMQVVDRITQLIFQHNPDGIFIDAGAGAGIIDRLKELGYKVYEVNFGSSSSAPQYFDHRTELWARFRDWLPGGMIDNHKKLKSDLCSPEKELIGRESKEKLESKEKMKRRGLKSPDHADALALTFHCRVARKDLHSSNRTKKRSYLDNRTRKSLFD
jgi:hypothetical protein